MLDFSKNKCIGCKLCAEVCNADAINFRYELGFWYPEIDEQKCTKCGLCEKTCPSLNEIDTNRKKQPDIFAVWTKNTEQRIKCTSGGICFELAKSIIDVGGYVAGVEWDEGYKSAHYTIVDDYDGLKKITQTKYFQVETLGVYSKVKKLLDSGKTVLYIGTPCTNAALHKYLGKEYDNLYNCEFICAGMPSPIVHLKNIEYLENKYNSEIAYYQNKNKKESWAHFGTYAEFKNGKSFYTSRYKDPLTIIFSEMDVNTRPSCYECKYRTLPRYADITVGDFWGILDVSEDDYKNGVSVCMINSDKGQKLFDRVKENIKFERRTMQDLLRGNPYLLNNPKMPETHDDFFEDVEKMSFSAVLKKYTPKYRCLKKIKQKYKRFMWDMKFFVQYDIIKFIYYNYFCKSVIRKKGCYIRPYRGSCIEIDKTAKLYLNNHLMINAGKVKGSKAESYLTLGKNAIMEVNGKAWFCYNNTINVTDGAHLSLCRVSTNVNTVIVCANEINMGHDVMIGRNVMIYDDDHHGVGKKRKSKPVNIGNHVWLCSNSSVMKNVSIGDGSIVSANSVVVTGVKERNMVYGNPAQTIMEDVEWSK